jgi:hypothetical protein
MRLKHQLFPVCVLILSLTGCAASVGGGFYGHSVTGHSGWFSSARLQSAPAGAVVTLGGKTVHVTLFELSWAGGSLKLPPIWTHLELSELFDSIVVSVDGQRFASIRPGVLPDANQMDGGVADR